MNYVKWISIRTETTELMIREVEKKLVIKLPNDYKAIALKASGGVPRPDEFNFANQSRVFNRLLSFGENDTNYIIKIYNQISDRLPNNIFPFASDPGGNYICFDYRNDISNPFVVFWDHEQACINKEKAIEYVCDTFTDLIDKLQ